MNRGYTREEYIRCAKMILNKMPNAVLSTDIITGFPGETEAQFQDTMSLLEEVPYENIFAFNYSPRPFTKAAKFTDQVPEEVKNERLNRLLERHREIAFKLAERYKGRVVQVLVEKFNVETGQLQGRSTHNKSTHFAGPQSLIGQTVSVKIEDSLPLRMKGTLLR
jgi:tRNA-2-methylthio-N6-dimethylallyladenosine synthase